MMRVLTAAEAEVRCAPPPIPEKPMLASMWKPFANRLAMCEVGGGIEIEVPEGVSVMHAARSVVSASRTLRIRVSRHQVPGERKIIFRRMA